MTSEQKKVGRRDFMSTAAAAAGLMIIKPQLVRGTAANSALRVGLLGCGERGTEVATALSQHPNARYIALADLFSDQLDKAKQHFDGIAAKKGYAGIDPKLMFKGPKAYQAIAESNQLDAIHIATPDFFHPWHLEAVLAAGKHCYCEKPTGVDVRAAKHIMELGKKAEGRLSLDIGFQIRCAPPYVEMVKRIHAGAIGKIAQASTYYHATGITYPPRSPDASPLELRIRNFYWDRVLSGDIIVDQSIHVIDICNWVLKSHPLKAVGTGGRKVRSDWGNTSDHIDVILTYPDNVRVSLNHVQFGDCFWDVAERFFGTKGVSESHYSGIVGIYGDEPWSWNGGGNSISPSTNIYALTKKGGAEEVAGNFHGALDEADTQKTKAFVDSILTSKYHNQAAQGAETTLSAILARTATYTGREVTWDELLTSNQYYDPDLEGIDLTEFESD
ncbi:MAG TPA: Gfo/Idh/MocA family oxidoreductase [Terriglobia bacterium]|nr:Gfo/Idh/MocA family oxidoreductase [Terriglobia bacterium]